MPLLFLLRLLFLFCTVADLPVAAGGASVSAAPLFPIIIFQQDNQGNPNDCHRKQGYGKLRHNHHPFWIKMWKTF